MEGLGKFLAYNNAVPIAVSILLLGAGSVFAATNPEALYDKSERIVSVDNSYIVSADLDAFSPVVQILRVTEDDENYYILYELETVDVVDGVWKGTVKQETLRVAKGVLGEYRDLGLYATEQFKQIVDREIQYLKEVQEIERRALTPKMVATAYSGLIGLFLDDSTETLPGYIPVVTPPALAIPGSEPGEEAEEMPRTGSNPPTIQLLGETPQFIALGSSYTDLGAVAQDDEDAQPEIRLYVDGNHVSNISLDTSTAKNWFIRYEAVDSHGNTNSVERIVVTGDPHAPAPTSEEQPSGGGSETSEIPSEDASTTPSKTPEEAPAGETPSDTPPAEETPAEAPAEPPAAPEEEAPVETPPEPAPEPASEPEPAPAPTTP